MCSHSSLAGLISESLSAALAAASLDMETANKADMEQSVRIA